MNLQCLFRRRMLCALVVPLLAFTVQAQEAFNVKEHYTKAEYQISMRDGVKLFTSVYVPKDASQKYPMIMQRTPYSVAPYGPDNYRGQLGPSPLFAKEGFIFVYQDVRGRNMSEGDFAWMRPFKPKKASATDADETTDTWDTIEWLLKNIPNNNGRVGMWGISYPGHYSAQALIDPHPALKAVSPQAPMADNWLGDDMHHNGALFLPHAFNFIINFGRPRTGPGVAQFSRFDHGTADGYKFFLEMGALPNAQKYMKNENRYWNEWMEHGDYDEYWQAQNVPQHLKKVTPAVMTVGGWFDAEDVQGPLWIYREIEKNNPKAWNVLVEGPWCHGCWSRRDASALGGVKFGSNTSAFYQENIEFPFFLHFLKDKGEMKLPEAYVFESGSNVWKTYESWPPKNVVEKSLYLEAGGKLSFDPPKAANAYDEYVSDPNKPVPHLNRITPDMTYEYMTDDQRFSANRTDVLVYQTDVLTEDVTIAGEILSDLYASTSGTDSDFVVKLIDVFPARTQDQMDGYQMLVRGEPMRAKYRNGWAKPEALKPNAVTHVPFKMPDVNHTFKKGHRIMIHIQSSWFPLVDRNPQKFMNIYKASDTDFQKATQRIYRSGKFPSRLKVGVLK
ncbi:MAG TPA: CocE/NonD family hydrolase [Blastocatellia bacterium]|nr:CocE/NonD family hydrolase [Blastocatellia bacterium]HMX25176.1 CocE/NonD family hydrolase [Blastocatellia bacterium]HMY72342.1 CocE/NonD family hydrolase [Blastocatellia bacterium]HMZ19244.1 CocE/NonD family hydrolase [Blastocatellia bacterium]HNG34490.1 CocE/NonD family hydrolase [Blastocatellia bacterium]